MTHVAAGLVGAALLIAMAWWFGLRDAGAVLRQASPSGLALSAALMVVVVLGYVARWRLLARAVGATPPLAHMLAARLAGDAVGTTKICVSSPLGGGDAAWWR